MACAMAILRGAWVGHGHPRFLLGPPFGPPVFSARNLLRKESKLPISLEKCLSFIPTKKAALDCYWQLELRHQCFMREKFFKNEISENISQKFNYQ